MAGTAAEPVAARDEPLAARDEPLTARDEPLAEREPVAARDEPLAAREEPLAARDEPLAEREPVADREEQVAPASVESEAPAGVGSQTSASESTYRRRPGLSRFRRYATPTQNRAFGHPPPRILVPMSNAAGRALTQDVDP